MCTYIVYMYMHVYIYYIIHCILKNVKQKCAIEINLGHLSQIT